MGSVAQAVQEFDEAVQVPWRPPLATAPALTLVTASSPGGRAHAARAARLTPPATRPAAPLPTTARRARRPEVAARAVCASCGARGSCSPGPLRLTRRARRLLAVLVAGGAVAAAAWVGGGSQDHAGMQLVGDTVTVVQPGDTLWSIARSVAGDADVRDVVDEIQRLNDLEGSALVPGQVLELP